MPTPTNQSWSRIPRAVASSITLDAVPIGVLWVDSEGEIGYANRHIQMLLDRPPGEVIGMNVLKLEFALKLLTGRRWDVPVARLAPSL